MSQRYENNVSNFRKRLEKYKKEKKRETENAREKRYERERVARDERVRKLYVATYGDNNDNN